MRVRKTTQGLTVQATAGSHVVILGMDMVKDECDGLLGFAVHRTDPTESTAKWMEGLKSFEATDPGFAPGAKYPTNEHPIQGFSWSDFTAKPGRQYTYRVKALAGTPEALVVRKETEVTVTTEAPGGGAHEVFFNRGAAASQEFVRRFGNTKPDPNNPADPRWAWLSRGVMEGIEAFVNRALDKNWGLRVSAYEFRLPAFAQLLKKAKGRKVDVRIVFDGNDNPPDEQGSVFPRDENRQTAADAGIESLCTERVTRDDVQRPPISHHKFIVLLRDGQPEAVLTGSTNYSFGGVFGQSNVVHVVNDPAVAATYFECWKLLQANTPHADLKETLTALTPPPTGDPAVGTSVVLSPQSSLDALEAYARFADGARKAVFMTFAFGMNKLFKEVYEKPFAGLRYALMDKLTGPGGKPATRAAEEARMLSIRKMNANRIAVGNRIATNQFDHWARETLTGLNTHVQFIHTKFMLVDPLSNDPMVVTGSANFSDASTTSNDENMLLIRKDRRTADIYLGEYMRLWNHYAFREFLAKSPNAATARPGFLDVKNKWWRKYFGDSEQSRQRAYFSGGA
ncbi:MAG: hypothetical protein JNN08_01960 [Bryobacterales bacterium]|nr:hypothetical protein [Bryobacterales bacterium]